MKAPEGFGYWLIKFDGVEGNRDKELNDPQGFGKIEYAYHRMALAAGLEMSEPRGIAFSPMRGLELSGDLSLNYIVTARRG